MGDDEGVSWEPIEHTADVGLLVRAPTLDELFAESARGLFGLMGEARGPDVRRERVSLEAPDLDALYVDWLSELLFLFEARGFVPLPVSVTVDAGGVRLEAEVAGPAGLVQHGPGVKAVTFHGLSVGETSDGWQARVYLDV